jgi:ribonuclease D
MDSAEPTPLLAPRAGTPEVVDTPRGLRSAVARLAEGTGAVAVDAERASGYRYGQRAFLVQLHRQGTGTILIDPVAVPDLSAVAAAVGNAEWVLHAASQDLPCLAQVGMVPGGDLFDTELGARLAGFDKVGLAAIVELLLGWQLAKEHSAVDWSTRPLPASWLTYAALDVDVLLDLRAALGAVLEAQGKSQWAAQEFAAVRDAPPALPRTDPWRRTSGLHGVRGRRALAVVRELWQEREAMARRRDVAPGRVLPDRAIVAAAVAMPASATELTTLPVFSGPANRRLASRWYGAIDRARRLPDDQLPQQNLLSDGPPPPRVWKDRDAEAARRLTRARAAMTELSTTHQVPVENLLTPELLRRLCWSPPEDDGPEAVAAVLRAGGARPWQVELTVPVLSEALRPTSLEDSPVS